MFRYVVYNDKNNLVIQDCENLEEAISVCKPLLTNSNNSIRIKKYQDGKVVREISFFVEEGKDILLRYANEDGKIMITPI